MSLCYPLKYAPIFNYISIYRERTLIQYMSNHYKLSSACKTRRTLHFRDCISSLEFWRIDSTILTIPDCVIIYYSILLYLWSWFPLIFINTCKWLKYLSPTMLDFRQWTRQSWSWFSNASNALRPVLRSISTGAFFRWGPRQMVLATGTARSKVASDTNDMLMSLQASSSSYTTARTSATLFTNSHLAAVSWAPVFPALRQAFSGGSPCKLPFCPRQRCVPVLIFWWFSAHTVLVSYILSHEIWVYLMHS